MKLRKSVVAPYDLSKMNPIARYIFEGRALRVNDARRYGGGSGRTKQSLQQTERNLRRSQIDKTDKTGKVVGKRFLTPEEIRRKLAEAGFEKLDQDTISGIAAGSKDKTTYDLVRARGKKFGPLAESELDEFTNKDRKIELGLLVDGKPKYGYLNAGTFLNHVNEPRSVSISSNAAHDLATRFEALNIASPFVHYLDEGNYPQFISKAAEALGADKPTEIRSPANKIPNAIAKIINPVMKRESGSDESVAKSLWFTFLALKNERDFKEGLQTAHITQGFDRKAGSHYLKSIYSKRSINPLGGSGSFVGISDVPRGVDKISIHELAEEVFGNSYQPRIQSDVLAMFDVKREAYMNEFVHDNAINFVKGMLNDSRRRRAIRYNFNQSNEHKQDAFKGIPARFHADALKVLEPARLKNSMKTLQTLIKDDKNFVTELAHFALQGGGKNSHVGQYAHGNPEDAIRSFTDLIMEKNDPTPNVVFSGGENFIQGVRDLDTIDKIMKDIGNWTDQRHRKWKTVSGETFSGLTFDDEVMAKWLKDSAVPFIRDSYNESSSNALLDIMINNFAPELKEEPIRLLGRRQSRNSGPSLWNDKNETIPKGSSMDDFDEIDDFNEAEEARNAYEENVGNEDFLVEFESDEFESPIDYDNASIKTSEELIAESMNQRQEQINLLSNVIDKSLGYTKDEYSKIKNLFNKAKKSMQESYNLRVKNLSIDRNSIGFEKNSKKIEELMLEEEKLMGEMEYINSVAEARKVNVEPVGETGTERMKKVASYRPTVNQFVQKVMIKTQDNEGAGVPNWSAIGGTGNRIKRPDQIELIYEKYILPRTQGKIASNDFSDIDFEDLIPWASKKSEENRKKIEKIQEQERLKRQAQEKKALARERRERMEREDAERAAQRGRELSRLETDKINLRRDRYLKDVEETRKSPEFSSESRKALSVYLDTIHKMPVQAIVERESAESLYDFMRDLTIRMDAWGYIGDEKMVGKIEKAAAKLYPIYMSKKGGAITMNPGANSNSVERGAFSTEKKEQKSAERLISEITGHRPDLVNRLPENMDRQDMNLFLANRESAQRQWAGARKHHHRSEGSVASKLIPLYRILNYNRKQEGEINALLRRIDRGGNVTGKMLPSSMRRFFHDDSTPLDPEDVREMALSELSETRRQIDLAEDFLVRNDPTDPTKPEIWPDDL